MKLYVIQYAAGQRGCPTVLKGALNNDLEWDPHDPAPDKLTIVNSYEFVSKNPLIDFDFWNEHALASSDFVELCRVHGAEIRAVPVGITQSDGKRTRKSYSYLLWRNWLSILDLDRSDYDLERDLETGEFVRDRFFPEVLRCEAIRKFVPDLSKVGNAQVFKCVDLDDRVVCTQEFNDACSAKNLVGITFEPLESHQKMPFWKT